MLTASDPYTASFVTNVWKAAISFLPAAAAYLVYAKLARIRFAA
jgi:hypothetical protein